MQYAETAEMKQEFCFSCADILTITS